MNYHVLFFFFVGQQPFFQIFNFYINSGSAAAAAVDSHVPGVLRLPFHFPAAPGKRFHAIISGTAPGHQLALHNYH
jgi:hypothetical protein